MDYKRKLMACIAGGMFGEAEKTLVHLKKLASMLLSQNDQKEFLEICFLQAKLEIKRHEADPEEYRRPNYNELLGRLRKVGQHIGVRDEL